jgi:hypothetical protein
MANRSAPGMTEYVPDTVAHIQPPHKDDRLLTIAMTTPLISSMNLYQNGLYQNILMLYKLFRSMNHTVYLIVNNKPSMETADILITGGYVCILPEDIIKYQVHIDIYIEVGMSTDSSFSSWLLTRGTRYVKYYLGNVINIDIEIITKLPTVEFPHHCPGKPQEIWTSPHYAQNLEYICSLFNVPFDRGVIAPYIWDPMFTHSLPTWSAGGADKRSWMIRNIVITEPNISFQKSAFLPILLADRFANKYPEWKGNVIVMNAQRFSVNVHAQRILEGLSLHIRGRIKYSGRQTIREIMEQNNGSVFIGHQINNEYNYMTFELMYKGFPILHNSEMWRGYGYYWSDLDIDGGISTLRRALCEHTPDGTYSADAHALTWNYSLFNPAVREMWRRLLHSM